jgi:hypothetical protein
MFKPSSIAVAIVCLLHASLASAEGYKLYEQSVSSMGNAYAGVKAEIARLGLNFLISKNWIRRRQNLPVALEDLWSSRVQWPTLP